MSAFDGDAATTVVALISVNVLVSLCKSCIQSMAMWKLPALSTEPRLASFALSLLSMLCLSTV